MENVCYFLKNTYLRCDRLVHRILPDRENNMSKDRPYYRIKWIGKKNTTVNDVFATRTTTARFDDVTFYLSPCGPSVEQ